MLLQNKIVRIHLQISAVLATSRQLDDQHDRSEDSYYHQQPAQSRTHATSLMMFCPALTQTVVTLLAAHLHI